MDRDVRGLLVVAKGRLVGDPVWRRCRAPRMYLGEIHFGELLNTGAPEPIITDRGLFERVRRRAVSRGRKAKSERRLARLGVLR